MLRVSGVGTHGPRRKLPVSLEFWSTDQNPAPSVGAFGRSARSEGGRAMEMQSHPFEMSTSSTTATTAPTSSASTTNWMEQLTKKNADALEQLEFDELEQLDMNSLRDGILLLIAERNKKRDRIFR